MSDEDIIVPYLPTDIIAIFKNEYPFIQELLDYKRDAALVLLKGKGAMAFYEGKFGFNVKSDVKDWEEFKEFSRNYTWNFVNEGLQKYQAKEKNNEKRKFEILDMGILGPAVELIANAITGEYLERFPKWPDIGTTQEDYIKLDTKGFFEKLKKQYYWLSRGRIKVKDTQYSTPRNGCPYRAEFSGKPEFQLAYFDLDKIRYFNDMAKNNMPQLKEAVDKIEIKLIGQSLKNLLIDIDI
jgi:hypothetical protein